MRKLTRQDLYAALFLLGWIPVLYGYNRATTQALSISLEDCQPRDVWARISRAYDPRDFWIQQNVKLEMMLEESDLKSDLADCTARYSDARSARDECTSHFTKWRRDATQCLRHSAKLCRIEGGRC
jgi:hypothetical protein